MLSEDRRRRRSPDPLVALHYQLSTARHEGELDTIVVADSSGIVVAGAGSWAACEELAAFAPLVSRGDVGFAHMRGRVTVRQVDIDGDRVLLCVRTREADGETRNVDVALDRAAIGISRILRAA